MFNEAKCQEQNRIISNDNEWKYRLNVVLSMMHGLDASDHDEVKRCRLTPEHRICDYRMNIALSMIHGLGSVRNEEKDVD